MARYEKDPENYYEREERRRRESPAQYDERYDRRSRSLGNYDETDYPRGRFGERADYRDNEPRYTGYTRGEPELRPSRVDDEYVRDRFGERVRFGEREKSRSRLRARNIMTRELAVAVRDNTLHQVARMMKDEDTGVIPVVEYDGDGATKENQSTRERMGNGYAYGRLIGLITDRDIVLRAVSEGKDPGSVRTADAMSTSVETASPTDRVVDVLHKMAAKQVRRIPVVGDNGRLLGMISLGDIALEIEADTELANAIEEISKESTFWRKIFR